MSDLVIVTKDGMLKRTDAREYKSHHRGTEGVVGVRLRSGDEVAAVVALDRPSQTLMIITNKGTALRVKGGEIPKTARRTQGVIGFRLRRGERIVSVTPL